MHIPLPGMEMGQMQKMGGKEKCIDITQAIKLFSLSSTEATKKLIWGAQEWEPLIDLSNKGMAY
ncbi:MAG: hypothetical protein FJ121_12910 [Deltaproteobacteria bacterium]|nr:hypothetical protein [Deltaproteobacteria bacterium]